MKQFRPEHELILRCARTELRSADQARILVLSRTSLDWSEVLHAAIPHGLAALLHRHLNAALGQALPVWVSDQLRAEWVRATAKSLYLARELVEILRRLDAERIQALAFKGPALAMQAYGDLSLRSFTDLDILVHEKDVFAAREVLLSQGYISPLRLTLAQFRALLRSGYNDELRRPSDGVKVELHWRFAPAYFGFRALLPDLWQRSEGVSLNGEKIPSLGREDLLILLCVHGAKHAWASLEGVVAVAELLRRSPGLEWESVLDRANQAGAIRMLHLGLLLAIELLDAEVPTEIANSVRADRRLRALADQVKRGMFEEDAGLSDGTETENLKLLSFHLATKDGWADRVRFCVQLLAGSTERDWEVAALPDRLFPLYFLARPFRLIARVPTYARWLTSRGR